MKNPTTDANGPKSFDGKVHAIARVNFKGLRLPRMVWEVLTKIPGVSRGEAQKLEAEGPLAVLTCLITKGCAVTRIGAAALVADLAKVMEVAVPVGEATIPSLLDMVDLQRPEMTQCMGIVALHMLST